MILSSIRGYVGVLCGDVESMSHLYFLVESHSMAKLPSHCRGRAYIYALISMSVNSVTGMTMLGESGRSICNVLVPSMSSFHTKNDNEYVYHMLFLGHFVAEMTSNILAHF